MSGYDSEVTNCPEGRDEHVNSIHPSVGMSPYATGGGGVSFERKVAVRYLAHLLVSDGAVELGDGRSVVSVSFQQAPDYPVDDLIIAAARLVRRSRNRRCCSRSAFDAARIWF